MPERQNHFPVCMALCLVMLASAPHVVAQTETKPNVLFISIDDLNDWIGCLGGHPQTLTPNLDRLAKESLLFTNAHCSAPACNPSRTAVFTGRSPHHNGLYANNQKFREIMPDVDIMPKTFSRYGYHSAGSGKLLHYFIDAPSWDDYFPSARLENPFPKTLYPDARPLSLPRGGPWQYVETDWGPLDATDEEYGGDYSVAKWISEQLQVRRDKPFFLACGLYSPHEPWFVPARYFEPFPLESIQLPSGYQADDLEDLPAAGKRRGPNRYFDHILSEGQWKRGIQGYLASIHFADAMLGKVLDALEQSPQRGNTIIVLWSDHGWHLGEKQHWQKFTGWRVCTRVPLMIKAPGYRPATCGKPVSLTSLFPTLLELCSLPADKSHDQPSLVPLLENPRRNWKHVAVTDLEAPGNFSLSAENWRYIKYSSGGEELYNISRDPYEWSNLASSRRYQVKLGEFRKLAPQTFAEKRPPNIKSLPQLTLVPSSGGKVPASKPDGNPLDILFVNDGQETIKVYWMDPEAKPKLYFAVEPGTYKRQQSRPGAVWLITDTRDEQIGYVAVGDRTARVVIEGRP